MALQVLHAHVFILVLNSVFFAVTKIFSTIQISRGTLNEQLFDPYGFIHASIIELHVYVMLSSSEVSTVKMHFKQKLWAVIQIATKIGANVFCYFFIIHF